MPVTAKFQAAKERMRVAKKEAQKIAQEAFSEGASEVFAAHPKLESFGWNQYTPYFNDGDVCEFGVNIDYPKINGEDEDTNRALLPEKWVGGAERYAPNENYDPDLGAALIVVKEFLKGFDEDDMKELFGDHMSVTVSRSGTIRTEQYEHD